MDLNVTITGLDLSAAELDAVRPRAAQALAQLRSGSVDMTGWVNAPLQQDAQLIERILATAARIQQEAELMVVLGIGGSYMGAKAAIEALPKAEGGIQVEFLGINFCTDYYQKILAQVRDKKTVVCAISKSGNTMEIQAALEIIRPLMTDQYGSPAEAAKHIIAVTDDVSGSLRAEANEMGYETFPIPGDIGGRYSMMTPAGLLPMAVAGIDIRALLQGAAQAAQDPAWEADGPDYAIGRYLMHTARGKAVDVTCFNHAGLTYFGEWMKQLFGESEGKEGMGLWPATLQFSTDLHSMGQFLQQGSPVFFETMLVVDENDTEITIPAGTFAGKTLRELNDIMVAGVIKAHRSANVPVIEMHIPRLDAKTFGQLVYFMEMTCAITASLMGVNPFNQPGVESYKSEMRKLCGME